MLKKVYQVRIILEHPSVLFFILSMILINYFSNNFNFPQKL